jgi:PEGA domain
MSKLGAAIIGIAAVALLGGCLERRVSVTSDPSGAVVYANDVELGRTPCEASFTYFGAYDVRVEKDGFEPLRQRVQARTPIYEYPPIDLVATAIPVHIEKVVKWHFKLEPALETVQGREQLEAGIVQRANDLRANIK